MTTPVCFRYHPKHKDVFAIIFDCEDRHYHTVYATVGQHSTASVDYIAESVRATPEQSQALLKELKAIGYKNIEVYNRLPRNWVNRK